MSYFPTAPPVVEPTELLIQKGSNTSLRCNTTYGIPDISIQWEKLDERVVNSSPMHSTSGSGSLRGSGQTLSGSGGSGQTLSGELEQYQLIGSGSEFDFAPVVFGDEGCYRCVAMGVASNPITVTGRQHLYFTHFNPLTLLHFLHYFSWC